MKNPCHSQPKPTQVRDLTLSRMASRPSHLPSRSVKARCRRCRLLRWSRYPAAPVFEKTEPDLHLENADIPETKRKKTIETGKYTGYSIDILYIAKDFLFIDIWTIIIHSFLHWCLIMRWLQIFQTLWGQDQSHLSETRSPGNIYLWRSSVSGGGPLILAGSQRLPVPHLDNNIPRALKLLAFYSQALARWISRYDQKITHEGLWPQIPWRTNQPLAHSNWFHAKVIIPATSRMLRVGYKSIIM